MSKNNLDFPHTCRKIDKEIDSAKGVIENYLADLVIDICPYITAGISEEIAKTWADKIYSDISGCFEIVRDTNSDMREQANKQINDLLDEITDLKEQLNEKD
jgi:hypothetical protein